MKEVTSIETDNTSSEGVSERARPGLVGLSVLLASFFVFVMCSTLHPSESQPSVKELYQKAKEAYSQGRYQEAVELFSLVNKLEPGYKWVRWRLARARKKLEKEGKKQQQRELQALYNRAKTFLEAGKTEQAEAELRKILAVNPDFKDTKKLLESLQEPKPRPRRDQKLLAELYDLGKFHFKRGNYELAVQVFGRILQQDPNYRDTARWASEAEKKLKSPAPEEKLAEALAGKPAPPRLKEQPARVSGAVLSDEDRLRKALQLLRSARYEEALDVLRGIGPESVSAEYARVIREECLKRIRHRDLARAELRRGKIDREKTKRLRELYLLAQNAFEWKDYEKAEEIAKQILEEDPFYSKAKVLLEEIEDAVEELKKTDAERERERRIRQKIAELDEAAAPPPERPPIQRPPVGKEPRFNLDDYTFEVKVDPSLEAKLKQRISANYEGPLDYLLDILFRATGVNIVADPAVLEQAGPIRLDCEDLPLHELLDFITRNYEDVFFTKGENTIFVTTPQTAKLVPKVIYLRKGLTDVVTPPQPGSTAITQSDLERFLEKLPDIAPHWVEGSTYILDRKRNILYLLSTPEGLQEATELIRHLDVTPPQVMIETRFVELSDDVFEKLGFEWTYSTVRGGGSKTLDTTITLPPEALGRQPAPGGGIVLTFNHILSDAQYRMVLDALRRSGKARVLVAPSIIAMNNSTATINITQQLVYVEDYEINRADISGTTIGGGADGGAAPAVTSLSEPIIVPVFNTEQEVGFILNVSPSVGLDSREISLIISPEITEEVQRYSFELGLPETIQTEQPLLVEQPVIARRSLVTKLTVADGSVVVIGGLMRKRKDKVIQKIPLLSDIPVLGHLFRRTTEQDIRTNLIIFVKATIYSSEGRQFADAGRTELSAGPAPQVPAIEQPVEIETVQ